MSEPYTVMVPMIARSDAFNSHRGVWAVMQDPELKPGDPILFKCMGEIHGDKCELLATVESVEKPGSCLREEMEEFRDWFKIHWV